MYGTPFMIWGGYASQHSSPCQFTCWLSIRSEIIPSGMRATYDGRAAELARCGLPKRLYSVQVSNGIHACVVLFVGHGGGPDRLLASTDLVCETESTAKTGAGGDDS